MADLEHSRDEASGKKLSKRERAEFGNRPLSGRRVPAQESDEWSPARKAAEALFAGDVQPELSRVSAAPPAADDLFDLPKL